MEAAMTLELTAEEARLLAETLNSYLSDLREEIVKTEKHAWIEALHQRETMLNAILARLPA
jgi:hypothetical protein